MKYFVRMVSESQNVTEQGHFSARTLSRASSFSPQPFLWCTSSSWLCFVRCLGNCKSPGRNYDLFQYYFLSYLYPFSHTFCVSLSLCPALSTYFPISPKNAQFLSEVFRFVVTKAHFSPLPLYLLWL